MNQNPSEPICGQCQHFRITYEPKAPRMCAAHGFKTDGIPSQIVYETSGIPCRLVLPKKNQKTS